jgi:hypothetical protein
MADKTITFTQNARYDSLPPVNYTAGQKVTLREDLADRWLKRGVATEDTEKAKAQIVAPRPRRRSRPISASPSRRTTR